MSFAIMFISLRSTTINLDGDVSAILRRIVSNELQGPQRLGRKTFFSPYTKFESLCFYAFDNKEAGLKRDRAKFNWMRGETSRHSVL